MDYTVEYYSEDDEDVDIQPFQAAGDEEAVARALKEHGDSALMVCRVEREGQGETNYLIWERDPHLVLKWVADGADTLDEAIAMLEGFVTELKGLREQGMELVQPVDGGNIILERPASQLVPD